MIPLTRPHFDEEELSEIKKVLASGWVAGQGPESKLFEEQIRKALGAKYCAALNNCTAALHLALLALKIGKGDEVIVSDYTFPATGHAVLFVGARPVFCDIKRDTFNIDENKIESLITPKTKAILVVDTFGNPCNMKEVMRIADKHGLKVIEDAACAFGSSIGGKKIGTFGHVGCFSFHARKSITTGEGGCLITDDKAVYDLVRSLMFFGVESALEREASEDIVIPKFTRMGFNYKLSDINCAVGIAQLKKAEKILSKKLEIVKIYREQLGGLRGVELQSIEKGAVHVYQSFVVLVDRLLRDKLIKHLKDNGVQTQIGTYSSCIQPVYGVDADCTTSIDVYERSIALPLFYDIKEADVLYICGLVKNFINGSARGRR